MNARPDHALRGHDTPHQGPHTDDPGGARDDTSDRQYTCLGCDQQMDSFTIECPGCGSRQFQTTVPGVERRLRAPGYDFFETVLARFNPYIPR